MRTLGRPSASTVASDMAVGSRGSPLAASSNQAPNSRSGSSASVKSPDVNQLGCLIGAESDILRSTCVVASEPRYRGTLGPMAPARHAAVRRLPYLALVLGSALASAHVLGGCSFSYQLDS